MSKSYTGGCACGAIRYDVAGEPAVMVDCQCRQCQRDSGTGHQSHLTFVAAEVKLEGNASHWQTVGDGGTVKGVASARRAVRLSTLHFLTCRKCSSSRRRAWTIQVASIHNLCLGPKLDKHGTISIRPYRNSTGCRRRDVSGLLQGMTGQHRGIHRFSSR